MSEVTATQVEKVRHYSVHGRRICSVLLGLLAASVIFLAYAVLSGPGSPQIKFLILDVPIGADQVVGTGIKAWLLIVLAFGAAFSAAILYLLRRMFDNMSRGEIFSAQNASHLRRMAIIILTIGALQFALPLTMAVMLSAGAFEAAQVVVSPAIKLPGMLSPFGTGLLLYLASWIMRVGLGVSDEAAELKRDAELVV